MISRDKDRVCLAQIGAANGIKGHVRVKPFTEAPEALNEYGKLEDEAGKSFKLSSLRVIKGGMLVVKFKGINDRNAAEELTGVKLYVDRDALPELDEEDDFYVEDLIGMTARDLENIPLGYVTTVHNFGAGDLLDIKPERGPSVLVPFTKAAVPELSLSTRELVVDLQAAGLLSDEEASDE